MFSSSSQIIQSSTGKGHLNPEIKVRTEQREIMLVFNQLILYDSLSRLKNGVQKLRFMNISHLFLYCSKVVDEDSVILMSASGPWLACAERETAFFGPHQDPPLSCKTTYCHLSFN